MAISILQSMSDVYKGVVSIAASAVSTPRRDANMKVLSAEVPLNVNVDYLGNPVGSYAYNHISTATTTTVKTGAGILGGLSINSPAAGTVTVYDSLTGSGTVIAVLTLTTTTPLATVLQVLQFSTGLTLVTSAAVDLTVAYN